MKRLSRLLYCLGALFLYLDLSSFAQLVEAPVDLWVEYVPRTAAVASVKTLTTAQVLAKLGINAGSLVFVGDGADASVPWSFKVKTVQGNKTSYTDLSGKVALEILGDSRVGAVNTASGVAPAKTVSLGKPQSTQTVKVGIVLSATEGFDFYGTVVTAYTVTQEAGKKVATWMPGACTAKLAGTYRSVSGAKASTASITAVLGKFKVSAVSSAVSVSAAEGMVSVLGGTLPSESLLTGQGVGDFQIGKTEVTWSKWKLVRDWAVNNGYSDLANVGEGVGDNYPVQSVSWYDVVKWCNAKSEKEGRTPVYQVNGKTYKTGQSEPTVSASSNGYRLPSEAEWEWAARGGRQTNRSAYSGNADANMVAWTSENSGNAIQKVGTKAANELGIFDMSGNVWEWSGDWGPGLVGYARMLRGGDFNHPVGPSSFDYSRLPSLTWLRFDNIGKNYFGFRVALSSVPQ